MRYYFGKWVGYSCVNNHLDAENCFLCSKVHYWTRQTQATSIYFNGECQSCVLLKNYIKLFNFYVVSHVSTFYLFPFIFLLFFLKQARPLEKVRQLREQAVCPQHGFPLSSHQQGSFELLTLCQCKGTITLLLSKCIENIFAIPSIFRIASV